jgi:hypothetical protein
MSADEDLEARNQALETALLREMDRANFWMLEAKRLQDYISKKLYEIVDVQQVKPRSRGYRLGARKKCPICKGVYANLPNHHRLKHEQKPRNTGAGTDGVE